MKRKCFEIPTRGIADAGNSGKTQSVEVTQGSTCGCTSESRSEHV